MTVLKGLIALAALALATGLIVEANDEFKNKLCTKYDKQMRSQYGNKNAADFFKKYLEENTGLLDFERKFVKVLVAVSNGECSVSSWDHIRLVIKCADYMGGLDEPLKAYTKKCLTPEYVSQKIKEQTSGIFAKRVDMVDSQFLSKFIEQNAVNPFKMSVRDFTLETLERYTSSATEAIERDFAKRGKDPKETFYANPDAVRKYMDKKLFKPCRAYMENYDSIIDQIRNIGLFFEGSSSALIASLDQRAKDTVFRIQYCTQLEYMPILREEMKKVSAEKFCL